MFYACAPGSYAASAGLTACTLVPTGNYVPLFALKTYWACWTSLQLGPLTCNTGKLAYLLINIPNSSKMNNMF